MNNFINFELYISIPSIDTSRGDKGISNKLEIFSTQSDY